VLTYARKPERSSRWSVSDWTKERGGRGGGAKEGQAWQREWHAHEAADRKRAGAGMGCL
jgi:hypothetical protein